MLKLLVSFPWDSFIYDLLFYSFVLLRNISALILFLYIAEKGNKVWGEPPF